MNKMKAAIYTGIRQIEVKEVEKFSPPPGYVLLDTKQTGICGSDLHNFFGEWPADDRFALGHETCGVIVEVGAGVTGFQKGDHVAAECFAHCGECLYCARGQYNHCLKLTWISAHGHGGFAEYTTIHQSGLYKLSPGMSHEEGALVEPLAVAYRTLALAKTGFRDRVLIIGGGTIGLLCLAMAKAAGVKEVFISVKYDQQAALAEELGATHVIDVRQDDVVKSVRQLTGGLGADAVIETVGGGGNFDAAISSVRKQGQVVLVAGYHEPLTVKLWPIVWNEINVVGANCYGNSGMDNDFEAAIELIATGRIPVTKLVTHRFPLSEIAEAFAVASDKQSGSVKVHIVQ